MWAYITDYRMLAILLGVVVVVLANRRIKDFLYAYRRSVNNNLAYDEGVILAHLQYIIQQCLDYYQIFHIVASPKEVYNINSTVQQEIIDYLIKTVPGRISPVLHDQLVMIYNEQSLGQVIGEIIYMTVQDFSITFNNEMANSQPRKPSRIEEKIKSE